MKQFLCILILVAAFFAAAPPTHAQATSDKSAAQASAQSRKYGQVDILTDTQGVDFGPYLQDAISKVRTNWYALIPEDAELKKGKLAIEFAIRQSGQIAGMKFAASSGDVALDRAAWGGITASSPLPALPSAFHGSYLALRFHFYYNPEKSDMEETGASTAVSTIFPTYRTQASAENTVSAPASNDSQPVLCMPNRPQTQVSAEVVNAAPGVDLHSYLDESVLPLMRANWYRLVSKSGEKVRGDATVQFTINKVGGIEGVKLTDGAGHAALGDLAASAVEKSAPFASLPSDFGGRSVDLRARFEYTPTAPPLRGTIGRICTADDIAKKNEECLTPPKVIFHPDPEFSEEARKKKVHGVVTVSLTVETDGTVQHACAMQTLGAGLEEKAVEAVRTWKFEPAMLHGKPAAMQLMVEVDFHLFDKPAAAYDPLNDPVVQEAVKRTADPRWIRLLWPVLASGRPGSGGLAPGCSGAQGCISGEASHVTPPRLVLSPLPEYLGQTDGAHRTHVTLKLRVNTDGMPEDIQVLDGLGPELNKKAIDAVSQWKFEPAMKDGRPVAVVIAVEVEFHLGTSEPSRGLRIPPPSSFMYNQII